MEKEDYHEEQKVVLVTDAYAVINPGTMVIKTGHTLIADIAVSRTFCFKCATIGTEFLKDGALVYSRG